MSDKTEPMKVVSIPAYGWYQPSPWNRMTWAEIRPMLVARLLAQGVKVIPEERTNNAAPE